MKNLFKNLNFGGVVALVAMVMLTVSWTNHEATKVADFQWYEISVIDTNEPHDKLSNLRVEGLYPGGEPSTSGDCPVANPNEPLCAKQLELPDTISFPITMQVVADNNYPQGDSRNKEEE